MKSLARIGLLLVAAVIAAMPATAHAQAASEAALKAALVYKLASYIEWPQEVFPSADTPFAIGVMAADDVATELEQVVRQRSVNNRPVAVRRVKEGESLAGLHLLFVGRRASERLQGLPRLTRPLSVLLVSESDRGLEAGSVINFVTADERVGFEVSIEAAERSNLKLSSRMLGVARRVLAKSP